MRHVSCRKLRRAYRRSQQPLPGRTRGSKCRFSLGAGSGENALWHSGATNVGRG